MNISKHIQEEISSQSNPEKARWLENYIKHDIQSKGVRIPEIREIIKRSNTKFGISEKPLDDQLELLNDLMEQPFTEDKLAAILFMQLFWKEIDVGIQLNLISNWFDKNWINDWNVCDWLCVRILSPILDTSNKLAIKEFKIWNKDKNLWKARASLVPFAQCKTINLHKKLIFEFSEELIKRDERFCKTAVGWVLREFSKIDSNFVLTFLMRHEKWLTKEVIKNATKCIKVK